MDVERHINKLLEILEKWSLMKAAGRTDWHGSAVKVNYYFEEKGMERNPISGN